MRKFPALESEADADPAQQSEETTEPSNEQKAPDRLDPPADAAPEVPKTPEVPKVPAVPEAPKGQKGNGPDVVEDEAPQDAKGIDGEVVKGETTETAVIPALPTDATATVPELNDTSSALSTDATAEHPAGITVEPLTTTGQKADEADVEAPEVSNNAAVAPVSTPAVPEASKPAGDAVKTEEPTPEAQPAAVQDQADAAPAGDAAGDEAVEDPQLNAEEANISLEEEFLLQQTAAQSLASTASELSEFERMEELSAGLEDLALIATGIGEVTPRELALIEHAGSLVVAGTDIDPEQVVPSLEAFGGRVNVDAIRAAARNIWETIRKLLTRMWERIQQYYYSVTGTIPALRRRLNEYKARLSAAEKVYMQNRSATYHPETTKLKVSSGVAALSVGGQPVTRDADLRVALVNLAKAADLVYHQHADSVAYRGSVIETVIDKFELGKARECALAMKTALRKAPFLPIPNVVTSSRTRHQGFDTQVGISLLGGSQLVAKTYIDNAADASLLGALDRYRRAGVELERENTLTVGPQASGFEFQVLSITAAKRLILSLESLLEMVEDYERKMLRRIQSGRKAIEQASARASAVVSAVESEQSTQEAITYYRAVINFNTAYARWASNPSMAMTDTIAQTVRASCMLLQKSIDVYHVPVAAPAAAGAAPATGKPKKP